MSLYFFDLKSPNSFSRDDEGVQLPDVSKAHDTAVGALVDIAREGISEGAVGQRFAVEVRNGIGSVLDVIGVFDSKIFRKQ